MSARGDYELDPQSEQDTIDISDHLSVEEESSRWRWIVPLLLLVGIAIGLALWWSVWRQPAAPEPVQVEAAETEEPVPLPTEPEPVDLPSLSESDSWLREVVGQLSEHPDLVTWLLNEDLIRRLVATVDNMVEGVSPRSHVRFLQPRGKFAVTERNGRLYVAAGSYRRYDSFATVVSSLHVDGTAQVYRNIEPLLDEAYRDLGYP